MTHDLTLCKCGHDSIEETADGPACLCLCEDCTKRREEVLYFWRLRNLEKRLAKANISADDLAMLVWFKREPEFEKRIDQMVAESIERRLQDMRVVSNDYFFRNQLK